MWATSFAGPPVKKESGGCWSVAHVWDVSRVFPAPETVAAGDALYLKDWHLVNACRSLGLQVQGPCELSESCLM